MASDRSFPHPREIAVTDAQFEALVARLEASAKNNPAAYRLRVTLLALLGNAYLGVVLLILAALFLASLASIAYLKAGGIKLAIVVGAFLWMILKALWVKVGLPRGHEVTRSQAPALFGMIDDLRHQLDAPHFHHVLVTDDFNAGVVQQPRLGIFGWPRNYLLIGLPLMKALSVEQFKAVLAHEFGHLARGHGRVSNWIYRQRLRWSRLMATLDATKSRGSFLFRPFLDRFAPYFNAYSFPLARANEYEADAASARLTSPKAAAEALTSVNVIGSYLSEQYWPQIHKMADDIPQPGFAPFSSFNERMVADFDTATAQSWLDQAMARKTSLADTHPALSDRLKAIGEAPRLVPPDPANSADRLLGDVLGSLSESFDQRWQQNILPSWRERHQNVQEDRRKLAELNAKHESGAELSVRESYDRAILTDSIGKDPVAAISQLRALHGLAPDNALVSFGLGGRLIASNDDSGRALIEQAMRLDEEAIVSGAELLRDYHWRNGREDQARSWHKRLIERQQLLSAAQRERQQVLLTDQFEKTGLSEQQLEDLRSQLRAVRGLRKAYLLRKQVRYLPEHAFFVLGFSATGFFQRHNRKRDAEIAGKIRQNVELPSDTIIINVAGNNYRFARKFRRFRWARIK